MNDEINGLRDAEVEKSRSIYGSNELKKRKKKSFFGYFLKNLNDPIIKILIVALTVSTLISLPKINYLETLGILLSILISTLVSTASEYSGENAFEKLREKSDVQTLNVIKQKLINYSSDAYANSLISVIENEINKLK